MLVQDRGHHLLDRGEGLLHDVSRLPLSFGRGTIIDPGMSRRRPRLLDQSPPRLSSAAMWVDLHWHDLRHDAQCRWLAEGRTCGAVQLLLGHADPKTTQRYLNVTVARQGLDLRAIQLLLGHADLKTTQRYLNVTDDELRKAMAQKLWNRGATR